MIATALITAALTALCALPGLILARGPTPAAGQLAAAATASIVTVMLATALLGEASQAAGVGALPAATLLPVALAASLGAWLLTRGERWHIRIEWHGAAYAAAMVAFGLFALSLALERTPSGGLLVHSYYNADWFKHLGHVHALANYGVPARDIFGGGNPLHYYWLVYILPGAGTALGGDAWTALAVTNATITLLFALNFYGLVRMAGPSPVLAFAVAVLGTLVTAPMIYFMNLVGGTGLATLIAEGEAPEPALLLIPQVIPQHALVLAVFVGWALVHSPASLAPRRLHMLSLAALTASLTISTLLGAVVLAAYGLHALWTRRTRALTEIALVAVCSGLLALALGVVEMGDPKSTLDTPLFANAAEAAWYLRPIRGIVRLFGMGGLALVCALFALRYWKAENETEFARKLALCLFGSAALCVVLSQALLPPRLAIETLIRARLVIAIAVALVGGWALREAMLRGVRFRRAAIAIVTVLAIVGLPAAIVRTLWLSDFGVNFTTHIPVDDLRVLEALREASNPRDHIWQFPEPPQAALPSGEDSWAPIIAGRTVPNSLRATDYASAQSYIERSQRWFAGEDVSIPASMDWVYLSRALHPASYARLRARMRAAPDWSQAACYPDACLFERVRASTP